MPSRPSRKKPPARHKRELVSADAVAKLYDVGPYDRNQVTLPQINRVRDIIELQGFERAAELIGVCQNTVLKMTSGFAHKLRADTAAKVREFLGSK